MGITQSLQSFNSFQKYHQKLQKAQELFYFSTCPHDIYKNKFKQQYFIVHELKFPDFNQMRIFLQNIEEKRKIKNPFNIIYPTNVFKKSNRNNNLLKCQISYDLIIVHKYLQHNLVSYMESQNFSLSENKIWFILNELSKSLQILEQNKHCNWFLLPQNIFFNSNENWFIYDGYFVIGNETENFCKNKVRKKQFMSQEMKRKIDRGIIVSEIQGLEEDIYCLGYCVVYMMTGIHPKDIPNDFSKRQRFNNQLFEQVSNFYSDQLINFVSNLTKLDPRKRSSIKYIRGYLKLKQQNIFLNEQQQWSKYKSPQSSKKTFYKKSFSKGNFKSSGNLRQFQSQQQQNSNSMRTLKKSPQPCKIILNPLPSQINSANRKLETSFQTTPIRKVQDFSSKRIPNKFINQLPNQHRTNQYTFSHQRKSQYTQIIHSPKANFNSHQQFGTPSLPVHNMKSKIGFFSPQKMNF